MIERLLAEPQRFEFFQAVRLLLLWLEERGIAPQQALDAHLRFANSLSLRFPASQVEALALVHDKLPGIARPQFRLTPSFMGLLGAHGTLPAHYTERIQAWTAAEHDDAPRAFLDMFSTRMLALYDLPRSPVAQRQIGAIVGLEHGAVRTWVKTAPVATLMPGIGIRLTVDEEAFAGSGLAVFVRVLDHYFALNAQLNCYTRLQVVAQGSGREIVTCAARTSVRECP